MLKLSHLSPFASGNFRHCFVHPHDPEKCVKPLRSDLSHPSLSGDMSIEKRLKKLCRRYIYPRSIYKYNLLRGRAELAEYCRLTKVRNERVWRHVPRHFGLVETDMGPAPVMELVRNHDGTFPPTLGDRICNGNYPGQAIDEFQSFLRNPGLPHWRDPILANVVCARIDAGGCERLFVVDGLECGRVSLLRSRMSDSYLRKLALRRIRSFDKKLAHGMSKHIVNTVNSRRC